MTAVLANLINELQAIDHGQLIDRGRVIDHLLDLRMATDDPTLTAHIDSLLVDVPGRSTVETGWWDEVLADLARRTTAELTH